MDSKVNSFDYCNICKLNYEIKDKNHVYSRQHRQCVTKMTERYLEKIKHAKSVMVNPVVKDSNFEREAKVWCYFCSCEVPKHSPMEDFQICQLGFLSHIKCKDHLAKTKKFFWENRVERQIMHRYILLDEVFDCFVNNVKKEVEKEKEKRNLEHQNEVKRIVEANKERKIALLDTSCITTETPSNDRNPRSSTSNNKIQTEKLNIFTGMIPPWLQVDDNESTQKIVGPDMSVYRKHLEDLKKAKLPDKRVGKDYVRKPTSEDWLPSFGRVWHGGSRNSSKRGFLHKNNANQSIKRVHYKPYNSKKYTL